MSKKPIVKKPVTESPQAIPGTSGTSGTPCNKRSGRNFQKFVDMIKKNPAKIDILLARALLNDDYLDSFDGQIGASECIFSYPNSDWFGVYMLDEDGNKSWNTEEGDHLKLYFKLRINREGTDAKIIDDTFELPDELKDSDGNEIENCVLRGTKCGDPDLMRAKPTKGSTGTTSTRKAATKQPEVFVPDIPSQVSPVLLEQLETLNLGGGGASSSRSGPSSSKKAPSKITRDYFEQLESKELITDYMVNNMDTQDLIRCVKRGNLSKNDLEEVEKIASMRVPESEEFEELGELEEGLSGLTLGDIETAEMARNIPESELTRMLKKVTKESISELINGISNKTEKKKQLVFLCNRAGINKYSTKEVRNVLRLFDKEGQIQDSEIPKIVDECASKEATKLRRRLLGAAVRTNIRLNKAQPVVQVQPVRQVFSVEQILRLSPDEQKQKIVDVLGGEYYTKEVRGKLELFDSEGQLDEEDDIPGVIAKLVNAMNSFGKRRKSTKSTKSTKRKVFKGKKKNIKY
jgi:hypothetical protein